MTPTEQIRETIEAYNAQVCEFSCNTPLLDQYLEQALALLDSHVLVPKEPTEEMIMRGSGACLSKAHRELLRNDYKAMIGVSDDDR